MNYDKQIDLYIKELRPYLRKRLSKKRIILLALMHEWQSFQPDVSTRLKFAERGKTEG